MNGKTVLLFPGLDAIFSSAKMKMWLTNDSVLQTVAEASAELSVLTGENEDLAAFIQTHKHLHLADFDRTLIALTALQVGIARELPKTWDLVQGCSHGDIARAVITESFTFKEAIQLLWIFAFLRKNAPAGSTANVRTRDGSPLSQDVLLWLADQGTPVSVWSDNNATIGASEEDLERIRARAEEKGIKVKPVLRFPTHSPVMRPSMITLREMTNHYHIHAPNVPVFSSIWVRYLQTGDDIREEALAGVVNKVRWMETLTYLHEKENAHTFINIGPSNTLTGWLFENPQFQKLNLIDSWDILKN